MGQNNLPGAKDSLEWVGILQDVVSPGCIPDMAYEYLALEQVIITDKFR